MKKDRTRRKRKPKPEHPAGQSGVRITLAISGLRCAADGAPLERALAALAGVRSAAVNPLLERVYVEVGSPAQVGRVVETLENRGYRVESSHVEVRGGRKELKESRREGIAE